MGFSPRLLLVFGLLLPLDATVSPDRPPSSPDRPPFPSLRRIHADIAYADIVQAFNGTRRELSRGDLFGIFDNLQALQGLEYQIQQNLASANKEQECHGESGSPEKAPKDASQPTLTPPL